MKLNDTNMQRTFSVALFNINVLKQKISPYSTSIRCLHKADW